ncbi:MAG: hypothetical protein Q9182_006328 [Xanthomendoza sp. 2 TL-2023]
MSRRMELAARSIDLVARNIDLVSTLVDATNTPGGLLNLGIQIGEWLQHEKVNRHELKDCFERAYGLAWPNKNGDLFRDEVRTKPAVKPLLPLFLQPSGSLGRLLVFDEALCWIVSTTGCLLNYHPEFWVTNVITTVIAESQPKSQSPRKPPLDIGKIQIRSIIKKIVSSVWYNIMNTGTETMGLPDALAHVCTVGHHLPPELMGRVLVALQHRSSHVVVRSPILYQNLTLWLLLHFHGRLVVTVSSKIVFQEDLSRTNAQQNELELRIASFCQSSTLRTDMDRRVCSSPQDDHIEVLENVAGKFESFLDEKVPHPGTLPGTDAQTRQELYNPKPMRETARLPESSKIWTRCTAQEIIRWLLNLSISSADDIEGYCFYVKTDQEVGLDISRPVYKIVDILKRMPGILNRQWGDRPPSIIVAERIEDESPDETERDTFSPVPPATKPQKGQQFSRLESLLPHFPILRELVSKLEAHCKCIMCRTENTNKKGVKPLREGCFKHLALSEVLILVSHAVADAFGVDDTSARRDTDSLVGLMTLILLGIVKEKSIDWNSWFCLASSVLLGCSVREILFGDRLEDTSRPICALQYGNLAAIAGWLDMTKELRVHGSFALNYGEGKLGTINDDRNDNQFRGILSDLAIVQTEEREDTGSYDILHPKEPDCSWSEMCDLTDHSKAKSDCILVSLGHDGYRLLTRVKSDTHSRIIDPTEAVVRVAAGVPLLPKSGDCTEHAGHGPTTSVPETITSYSFDEVLGRWPEAGELGGSNYFVSSFLDTNLKTNVAYALLVDDRRGHTKAISTSENPCVSCIAKYHGKKGARNDKPMYIINAAPHTPKLKRAIMATPSHS